MDVHVDWEPGGVGWLLRVGICCNSYEFIRKQSVFSGASHPFRELCKEFVPGQRLLKGQSRIIRRNVYTRKVRYKIGFKNYPYIKGVVNLECT